MKNLVTLATLLAGWSLASAQSYVVTLEPLGDGGRTGTGSGTLSLSGTTLSLDVSFSGLSGTANNMHIHGPSAPFPATAGVIYDLVPIGTLGGSSGTISGDVTLVDPKNGFTLADQLNQLNSGQWYVNIHSTTFGGGELRGTITAVPEPGTWALAIAGALMGWVAFRRRD